MQSWLNHSIWLFPACTFPGSLHYLLALSPVVRYALLCYSRCLLSCPPPLVKLKPGRASASHFFCSLLPVPLEKRRESLLHTPDPSVPSSYSRAAPLPYQAAPKFWLAPNWRFSILFLPFLSHSSLLSVTIVTLIPSSIIPPHPFSTNGRLGKDPLGGAPIIPLLSLLCLNHYLT